MKEKLLVLSLFLMALTAFSQDGSLDVPFNISGTAYMRSLQKLSNGKIIATHANSTTGGIKYYNADATNFTFTFQSPPQQTGFSNNWIQDIVEQPDGKILFIGANNAPKIFRYHADGTLDSQFQTNLGTGVDMKPYKAIVEPNGKIVVIGAFTSFNGTSKGCIFRLNEDGTLDPSFVATGTPSSVGITDIIRLADGKFMITGPNIAVFNGVSRLSSTMRLENDGSVDTSYQADQGANFVKIALQSDNAIIGAGDSFMWKLNPNGTQINFGPFISIGGNTIQINQGNSSGKIAGLHVQNDNKIIITGTFNKISGTTVPNHIIRFNADGTIDPTFSIGTGPGQEIYTSQLTDDGKILIGGVFFTYNGVARNYIARLNNNTPPLFSENLLASHEFIENETQLMVYPNPTNGVFTIQTSNKMLGGHVRITSILGQNIKTFAMMDTEIQADLHQGIYIIEIEKDGTKARQKLIVK
jgi:uncharacterized delta-60 repeat protein